MVPYREKNLDPSHFYRFDKNDLQERYGDFLVVQRKIIDAENRILADWGPETSEQYLALNERYLKCLQKELQRMKAEK